MFSATLHSDEVKDIAKRICHQPILVDLKVCTGRSLSSFLHKGHLIFIYIPLRTFSVLVATCYRLLSLGRCKVQYMWKPCILGTCSGCMAI